jgi:hypothetical protein
VSQSGNHSKAGHLGTADLTASTVANIALVIVAAAAVIAVITVRRHPATGAAEGATFSEA